MVWLPAKNQVATKLKSTFFGYPQAHMNYRQIIGEAWLFTQENKKMIVWYAFVPSILGTIVGVGYILYQFFSFKTFFENANSSFLSTVFQGVAGVAQANRDLILPALIALIVLAIMYFFLPPFTEGATIQLIARKKNGQEVRMRDGIRYGLMNFLPLFEYSLVVRSFSLFSLLAEAGLALRLLGWTAFETFLPVIIFVLIVSLILTFFFSFTNYYIVIDDCKVTQAMAKSATLVSKHWDTSIMITFLMLVIAVRILLQIVFVLLVPMSILVAIYFVAASSLPAAGFIMVAVVGFLALLLASYLGAVVGVFSSSVWIFTFLQLTNAPDLSAREQQ